MRRSSILQLLAVLAMTIDHIGSVFFPEVISMRLVGRAAMPIFGYSVAVGYRVTRDRQQYFARLIALAFLSQVPWMIALGHKEGLNICFTLAASLPFIYSLETKKYFYALLFAILVWVMKVEYSLYALAIITVMRLLEDSKKYQIIILTVITLIYSFSTGYYFQIFSIIIFPIILYLDELKERLPISRKVFYAYYPAHLIMIIIGRILYV